MSNKQNIHVQSGYVRPWVIAAGIMFFLAVSTYQMGAEDAKPDTGKTDAPAASSRTPRKLMHKVDPVYPQDLKRRSIGGTVKLDVKITAGGTVEKVAIVGGNPILADSAARAVKQWQYAPSSGSSTMLLNVEFNPNH